MRKQKAMCDKTTHGGKNIPIKPETIKIPLDETPKIVYNIVAGKEKSVLGDGFVI